MLPLLTWQACNSAVGFITVRLHARCMHLSADAACALLVLRSASSWQACNSAVGLPPHGYRHAAYIRALVPPVANFAALSIVMSYIYLVVGSDTSYV